MILNINKNLKKSLLIASIAFGLSACDSSSDSSTPENTTPVLTSTGLIVATEGTAYSYAVTATDPDNETLTMSASALPSWLSFDTNSGVLEGTPGASDVGNHDITIMVDDGTDSVSQTFTITVSAIITQPSNSAPVISSTAVTAITEGEAYSYTLTATDANNDTLIMSSSTLPSWLSFDVATGILSGTPATADVGSQDITLTVNDGTVTTDDTFTITVSAIVIPPANTAAVITSTAIGNAPVDAVYSYTLTATDADNDTLSMSATGLPTWLTFNAVTGVLSGTPVLADVAATDITLTVNDGTVATDQTFTVTVPDPITTPTGSLLFNFDEVTPVTLANFNEGILSSDIVDDPVTGAGNKVFMVEKSGTAASWEGTTISTHHLNSVPQIMVTATDKILTAKVYSPAAGVRIEAKVENAENAGMNKEAFAYTTKANEWETLAFDLTEPTFLDDPTNTAPSRNWDANDVYNKISFMADQTRTITTDATFYIDDVYFQGSLGATLTAPPAAILPTTLAATPSLPAADVLALHTSGDVYTNISASIDWNPNWGQGGSLVDDTVDGKTVKKLMLTNYQGIDFAGTIDITGKATLHMSVFVNAETPFNVFVITGAAEQGFTSGSFVSGTWNEIEVDLSATGALDNAFQIKFDGGAGDTYWIDNVYFH